MNNSMCPMCYQDMDKPPRTSRKGKYCGWCGQALGHPTLDEVNARRGHPQEDDDDR